LIFIKFRDILAISKYSRMKLIDLYKFEDGITYSLKKIYMWGNGLQVKKEKE